MTHWDTGSVLTVWPAIADDGQVIIRCDQCPGFKYGPLAPEDVAQPITKHEIRIALLKFRSRHTTIEWPGGERS